MLIGGTRVCWSKGPDLLVPAYPPPAPGLAPILCWGRATNKPMASSPHYLPYTSGSGMGPLQGAENALLLQAVPCF